MRRIYLDYNATTPVAPAVQEAVWPFLSEHFGNPSSEHVLGHATREAIEDARQQMAHLLGAYPEEIVFTGGGTESNNLAIKGSLLRPGTPGLGHLVISGVEHPAVTEPARFLKRLGYDLTIVGCGPDGMIDPAAVANALRPETLLVSVMHANNEVGTIQPIRQIAELCRRQRVLCHTDAAQSVGKIRVDVTELGVDLLSVAGHKLYAPKGVGALYVRSDVELEPLLHGAAHERGLRAGTENAPFIVGLGCAARLAAQGLDDNTLRASTLRDRLWERLQQGLAGQLSANGHPDARLPNTLSINFPRVTGHELLARTPEICASTGAACHSGATHISATLAAMGIPPETARGTVRLSLGWYTSEDDVDRAADLLTESWLQLAG